MALRLPSCYYLDMERIRILVAEDHSMVREGTCRLLANYPDFEIVGEAKDGREALELATSLKPDVVISDIRMPEVNGMRLVAQLRSSCPCARVLVLTAYDDEDYILAVLKAGAGGYLLKTVDLEKLAQAIRTVHTGQVVIDPKVAAKMLGLRSWQTGAPQPQVLSPRERDVLRLASRGMRTGEIADELGLSASGVARHVTMIMTKLGVSSRAEAVRYALSNHLID